MKIIDSKGKLKIKAMPKNISQEVTEKYIEDNKLMIDLNNESISPFHKLLIQLYYYEYLKFIYLAGWGRTLFRQLAEYMYKYHNIKERYTKDVVAEMELYKLVKVSRKFNNNFIELTYPAQIFFNEKLIIRGKEIGSIKRNTFIAEHYLRFKPTIREKNKANLIRTGILSTDKIKRLEKHNIFIENVKRNTAERSVYIVFGILDVLGTLSISDIKDKIEFINENLNIKEGSNTYFRTNICTGDYQRCDFLSHKWNQAIKEDKLKIEASFFDKASFSNLNTERYFTASSSFRLKDYMVNGTLEQLEEVYIYKEKIDRDSKGNMMVTFAVLQKAIDINTLRSRIKFIDDNILSSLRKVEFKLNVYVDEALVDKLNDQWIEQTGDLKINRFKGLEFIRSTKTQLKRKPKMTALQ